jgi:hypothetical protein
MAHLWASGGELVKTKRWRFGVDQTTREERAELEAAKEEGRAEQYVRGQVWSRMIEAETARRRARPANRRPG